MNDYLGREIRIGDTLAYSARTHNATELRQAIVCSDPEANTFLKCLNAKGAKVHLKHPERTIIIARKGIEGFLERYEN
jgi:hypothetical protein